MATDYNKIAQQRITRPAEQKRYPKLLVYGRNKKGKTTFAISGGVEQTLVLDPEMGTSELKTKNPHVWNIEKWEDLEDALNFLKYGTHDYKWVSVDGLTRFANMSLKYVMKLQEEKSLDRIPGFVQQRDYGKSGELMKEMINRLHKMDLGVIFTAQERMEEVADSEEDEDAESADAAYVPDLPRGVRGTINSVVDVIGRLYIVKNDDGRPVRRLWIGDSLRYDTGYRSDYPMPDYLEKPTIPRLVRLIRTGNPNPPKASKN